jgi:transcriptional regulator with XRE-family HTH domain
MEATMAVPKFGPQLRRLREAAGLTQVQLAELAGLHTQSVVKIERSERSPNWDSVVALAEALGCTPNDFLTEPEPPPAPKPPRKPRR